MPLLPPLVFVSAGAPMVLAANAVAHIQQTAGNLESWIALGIIATSVLTAWLMNGSVPKVRVSGTLLAASGCLALAGWFLFFVLDTGFLEHPKPNQTPLDSAKPALLWIQALTALVAGLILIFVAIRQRKSQETLTLTSRNEPDRYGMISRLLHWSIAILFIALIPMGIFASIIPEDISFRNGYYVVHKTIGVAVFALILVRLLWNRLSRRPALDPSMKPWQRKLAHRVHITLYVMMIALPITGFVMTTFHGYPTFFFAWELPPLWDTSETGTILFGMMHKYLLPYVLYIVLGAHIIGAVRHQLIHRQIRPFKRIVS